MSDAHEPPKLHKRHLAAVFAVVLAVAAAVVWSSLDASRQVAEKSEALVRQHVPELRAISDLQGVMNLRVRQLYLYYATAASADYGGFAPLAEAFAGHLGRLLALGPPPGELPVLQDRVAAFEASVVAFHREMSRGQDRDWDRLRDHLADAQGAAEVVDRVLGRWQEDTRRRAGDGARLTLQEVARMNRLQLGFSAGVMVMAAFFLVTWYQRFQDHARIYHRAYHEWVTGLPNRRRLEQAWGPGAPGPGNGPAETLLLVGLDRFQMVTGTFGHLVGDQLLVAVSRWIRGVLDPAAADTELYYLSPGVWLIRVRGLDPRAVEGLAARLLELSRTPMALEEREVNTSCSIGVTRYPEDGASIGELLSNGDAALRQAYRAGGHCYRCYEPGMGDQDAQRLSTESALRKAIEHDELVLHYQPKVDAHTGAVVGAEVLVRWQREGVLVYPGAFIPIAEQSALILPVGQWILARACRQWAQWRRQGRPQRSLAVNVSAQQFHRPDFPQRVADVLAATGMPPGMLELEITEAAAAEDPEQVIATMKRLKSIGVTLAVDDFGTGYSALAYLKRFPIDVLKVDQSFVRDIETSAQDRAIIDTILALARDLGLTVVAEGVESEAQRGWLRARGCQILQGYLFSPPLPSAGYLRYLGSAPGSTAPG